MTLGDGTSVGARSSIIANGFDDLRKSSLKEPPHHAPASARPSDAAQWDEVRDCWVEWDDAAQRWVAVAGDDRIDEAQAPDA